MNKIVFYIETKQNLRGNQTLFFDLATYIADHTENEVYYVNNVFDEDYNKHPNSRLKICNLSGCDFSQFDGATFFTPVNYLVYLLIRIKNVKGAKIALYAYDSTALNRLLFVGKKSMSTASVINLLKETSSCSFVDKNVYKQTCIQHECSFSPQFLPLHYHEHNMPKYLGRDIINQDVVNVAYLGTLDLVAFYRINNFANDLLNAKINKQINFHIVGNGRYLWKIDMSQFTPHIKFYITGDLDNATRSTYLRDNVDIVVATDHSAIDAAAVGVPVILPINSTKTDENSYCYFYNTKGFIYNWDKSVVLDSPENTSSVKTMLSDIYDLGKKQDVARKCYDFCLGNNSLEVIYDKFDENLSVNTLTAEMCFKDEYLTSQLNDFAKYAKGKNNVSYDDYKDSLRQPKKSLWSLFKNAIKKIFKFGLNILRAIKRKILESQKKAVYFSIQRSYKRKTLNVRNKYLKTKKIKVAFIVVFGSVFPTKPVFELMLKDDSFDPYIIVAPNVSQSFKYQTDLYKDTFDSLFAQYGERVVHGYNAENDSYLELKDEYGIIFFCNPYKHLVHEFHHIDYFLDKNVLPIYSSYGFAALKFWDEVIATNFYNYLWKACVETKSNLRYLKTVEKIKGRNGVVTGYIKMDNLAKTTPSPRTRLRILICPHHTVWGWKTLNISNFLTYAEFFVELPQKFPDIDFVFRPHPLLVSNLKAHKVWSQQKIDDYFERLLKSPNMSYDKSSDYFQQFVDSDAMIHDCGSFIGEYLYTKKPCCYMMKDKKTTYDGLVPLGQQCMDNYYHAFSEHDIVNFIESVVLEGKDPMKEERENFVDSELMTYYPHASDKIIDMIKSELKLD